MFLPETTITKNAIKLKEGNNSQYSKNEERYQGLK